MLVSPLAALLALTIPEGWVALLGLVPLLLGLTQVRALLVNNKVLGGAIRRYGNVILPVVLITLGLSILAGASVLLR